MIGRLAKSPCSWCVLFLGLAELVARLASPYGEARPAADSPRNAWNRRGWPEYTRAPATPADPLVVLLGNSQALGLELHDPEACYPARLDTRLRERHPGGRLENWASVGLRATELEVLSLQAVDRGADLLVVALSYKNFDGPGAVVLDYGGADIDLLAGRPGLWRPLLETTLTGERTSLDDLFVRAIQLGSGLGRMRRPLLDAAARNLELPHHRMVFGHPTARQFPAGWAEDGGPLPSIQVAREAWRRGRGRQAILRRLETVSADHLAAPLNACRAVIDRLVARAEAAGLPLLWVWVPMDTGGLPESMANLVETFHARASFVLREHGVPVVDLAGLVPTEEYVSLTHFDGDGHARMTRELLPAILDALP